MKKIILVAIALSFSLSAVAQDFVDNALLFSRTRPNGSARIQALGGAQVSLGGDYSTALSNPAGLGMYNRSEFTFSPGLNFINSSTDFFGETADESRSVFSIPGISLVFQKESGRETGFLGGSFAITLNRTNDFHQDYRYTGINNNHSILDYFIQDAGNIDPDLLLDAEATASYYYSLTGLAYRNFLIEDRLDDEGNLFYDSPLNFTSARQQEVSERKGAMNQWSLAYGANFSDKFFLGASLGISSIRFKLSQTYSEFDLQYPDNTYMPARDFTLNEDYDIRGSGVNLTLGAIYRPVDFLQVGASLVTPTYYQLTDTYSARMESNWNNFDFYPEDPDDAPLGYVFDEFDQPLIYEYSITTPMKFSTGVTLINKLGFITADVEFVNYGKAKYRSDVAGDFSNENQGIKSEYSSVVNYRVGAEYRFNIFRVRAGYNYMADPVVFSDGLDRSIQTISGGVGVRTNKFFVDLAALNSKTNGRRIPYFAGAPDPVAESEFSNLNFILTVGFNF